MCQPILTISELLKSDGYEVVSGPRTTGDGYYESCIVGIEGNQIEITVWKLSVCRFNAWQVNYNKRKEILHPSAVIALFSWTNKLLSIFPENEERPNPMPGWRGCIRGCNRFIVSKWWLRWMQSRLLSVLQKSFIFNDFYILISRIMRLRSSRRCSQPTSFIKYAIFSIGDDV